MTNIPISNGQYKVGTAEQIAIAAGEQNPVADNNGREGWLFIKAAADSAKFNYHLYSDGTMPIILGNLTHLYSNISLETLVANSSKPWITIYTKPQGSGDAGSRFKIDGGEVRILNPKDLETQGHRHFHIILK